MRFHARMLVCLGGLALAPVVAVAGPPGDDNSAAAMANPPQQQSTGQHHKGLFHRRHCVECQRRCECRTTVWTCRLRRP